MKKISVSKLKNKKGLSLVVVIIAMLLGLDLSSSQINLVSDLIGGFVATFDTSTSEYENGEVVRVVDGDTLVVNVKGEEQRVRLIGVDTPESVGKYASHPEPFGKEASAYTKKMLEGEKVYLEKDERDTDSYDRLLRYVWLDIPKPNDQDAIESKMFNAMLLVEGFAEVMTIAPDDKHSDFFISLEEEAKSQDIGLWGMEND